MYYTFVADKDDNTRIEVDQGIIKLSNYDGGVIAKLPTKPDDVMNLIEAILNATGKED